MVTTVSRPTRWRRFLNEVWWVQLVLNPPVALDLVDNVGKIDHGKVLPAVLLFSAIAAQFVGHAFAIGALIVLGSLAYGYGAWRAFLKSRTVTSNEQLVRIERDPVAGTQPTADRDWDGVG